MAPRKPCPWPETGTSEGGLHKKLSNAQIEGYTPTTKRVHMTRATGRWPLGRQGRTCMFQKNLRRLAPARTALHGASSQAASEGHLSTCPCLVKTIKTAGLFGYWLFGTAFSLNFHKNPLNVAKIRDFYLKHM